MRQCLRIIIAIAWSGLTLAQSPPRPKYLERARIQHTESGVAITANDSIPLFQAVYAVRLEFGWRVYWESAPGYSHFDVVDDTDPKWRVAHPAEKGVTRPSGGLFRATIPEPASSDRNAERDFLGRLVDEYNSTSNPGKYVVKVDSEGQLFVVGTQVRAETGALQTVSPLLDTPLTLTKTRRSVDQAIESILAALSSATGKKVIIAAVSESLFRTTETTVGGDGIAARDLLAQALADTNQLIQYDLFFNPDVPVYILSFSPAMKEEDDGLGGKKLIPIGGVGKPTGSR